MVTNVKDPDSFRTVTLRCSAGGRPASPDCGDVLYAGDSLKLVLTQAKGVDESAATLGFFGADGELVSSCAAFPFTRSAEDPGMLYATVSLATDAAHAAVAECGPGDGAPVRCYVYDGVATWADAAFTLMPQPLAAGGTPGTGAAHVTKAELKAVADAVSAMDTLTAAQREARMNALLAALAAL